jgi:hypothetical protein
MRFNFMLQTNGLLTSYCDKILQIRFKTAMFTNEMSKIRHTWVTMPVSLRL